MNSTIARKRLRDRREKKAAGAPWWLIALLGLMAAGVIGLAVGVGTVFAAYQHYAKDYVPIDDLLQQRNIALTEIYDRGGPENGKSLGILTNANAQLLDPVPLAQISPNMINATVSTEDNGFWEHEGISYLGVLRAAYENYFRDTIAPGRSTIPQQLIKNVYICPSVGVAIGGQVEECIAPRTVDRKLREIVYAMELDGDYEKEQILEWYLNQISYADRYVGVQAAAEGYFHKDASELTLAEAAMLSGIPAFPTLYHPRLNCEKDENDECVLDEQGRMTVGGAAKERQEFVLDLMVEHDRATRTEVEAAKAEPLKVFERRNDIAAAAWIDNQIEPRLVRMCNSGILPLEEGAEDCVTSVHGAGYQVTTTLDWAETQKAIQMIDEFVSAGLEDGCECHNAAIATIEPTTGEIIIYAPNRDPNNTSDDRVAGDIDQLVEINQPGSSFKPVVYLTWFDRNNKNPMSTFWDTSPLSIGGVDITNPRPIPRTEGLISARAALGGSQNVGAFRAAAEAGPDNVIVMAKAMGITTLDQHFDPTWTSHDDVNYGASIATGGANIMVIDMAYMNSVIANMGVMVGLPTLAETMDMTELRNKAFDTGEDYDIAVQQQLDFQRGHTRLPGTRQLDPVAILEVRDIDGNVIYTSPEPERIQVVDAGSVWLLHSIMSDCTARFIIWGCGGSNTDNALDAYDNDGVKIPTGIKTGTQQGPLSAVDTLETWMNGYSRYAATAVWVGNSDNSLVLDGPAAGYAAAHTTTWLFKHWMGEYHSYLKSKGRVSEYEDFSDLQPGNVAFSSFTSPATDRTFGSEDDPAGGCDQEVTGWVRTDVEYESECEEAEIDTRNGLLAGPDTPSQFREPRDFVKLPDLKPDDALELAEDPPPWAFIPVVPETVSTGQEVLRINSPNNGSTIGTETMVNISVNPDRLRAWRLEYAESLSPSDDDWKLLAEGTDPVSNQDVALLSVEEGVESTIIMLRLTAAAVSTQGLVITHVLNYDSGATPTPSGTPDNGSIPAFPNPDNPTPTPDPFAFATPTKVVPPPAPTETPTPN